MDGVRTIQLELLKNGECRICFSMDALKDTPVMEVPNKITAEHTALPNNHSQHSGYPSYYP